MIAKCDSMTNYRCYDAFLLQSNVTLTQYAFDMRKATSMLVMLGILIGFGVGVACAILSCTKSRRHRYENLPASSPEVSEAVPLLA